MGVGVQEVSSADKRTASTTDASGINPRPIKKAKIMAGPPPFPNGTTQHHADHHPGLNGSTNKVEGSSTANGLPPPYPDLIKQNGMRASNTMVNGKEDSNKASSSSSSSSSNGGKKSNDHAAIELEAAKSLMRMGNINGSGEGSSSNENKGVQEQEVSKEMDKAVVAEEGRI